MSVDRVIDRFDRGHEQAQRTAKDQLGIIMRYRSEILHRAPHGAEKIEAAQKFQQEIAAGGKLTPNQMSFVDAIYEAMWKAIGYESYQCAFKPRKGLRYPR